MSSMATRRASRNKTGCRQSRKYRGKIATKIEYALSNSCVTIRGNPYKQEVMIMMQGNWMGGWGTGYMSGWGGLWMVLIVVLVIAGIVVIMRKK